MKDRRISLCIVTFNYTHEFHRKVCKALKNLRVALWLRSFHPLVFGLSNLQRASILIRHATVNYLLRAERGLWSRRARNAWLLRGSQGKLACDHTFSLYLCNLLFGEEGMIKSLHRSHAKQPESGLFSDWIGNNTDDLRCSDWPKCRHPLVVVDFSLHFCLRNEQWIHTRVRYEISAGSVFLNLKNV